MELPHPHCAGLDIHKETVGGLRSSPEERQGDDRD